MRAQIAAFFLLPVCLTGCAVLPTAPPVAEQGLVIQGQVHGGQQPISGAHVYLFAANTTGYGAASVSLLSAAATSLSDSVGAYVLSQSDGTFSISGDYVCSGGQQVYLYAQGGDAGAGTNSAIGMMAVLGNCPSSGNFAGTVPFLVVNEVSTIASAYALAGFATDPLHVSSSGTALANIGVANAFGNAANLYNISAGGGALAVTPAGNGIVPQAEINTLGNILATCVNSTGAGSTPCTTLFANAQSGGSTGTVPADTATAAINIAHNPVNAVGILFRLPSGIASPFQPALSTAPSNLVLGLTFSGGGLVTPIGIAVNGSGDIWIADYSAQSVVKMTSAGVFLSGSVGFSGGVLAGGGFVPMFIAIDASGNAWVANGSDNTVAKLSSAGALISGSAGYSGGGLVSGIGELAIDHGGNVWVTGAYSPSTIPGNTTGIISEFSNSGTPLSPAGGYPAAGLAVAADAVGNVWVAGYDGAIKLSASGAVQAIPGLLAGGDAINTPYGIAVDAGGNVWEEGTFVQSASVGFTNLVEFSNSGQILSPSDGFGDYAVGPGPIAIDGAGNIWNITGSAAGSFGGLTEVSNAGVTLVDAIPIGPYGSEALGMAIDGSGNVWIANETQGTIVEGIGIAVPVVTPLAAGAAANMIGTRP